MDLVTV